MYLSVQVALLALSIGAGGLLLVIWRNTLPPGPGPYRTNEKPWVTYATWSKKFGPMVTVSPIWTPIIVINDIRTAIELLDKRGTFACKPRWPMAELLGRQNNVGFQYYGERLKKCRRVLHGSLNSKAIATTWAGLLDKQSNKLAHAFLQNPERFYWDVHSIIERFIIQFTYGQEAHDDYLELARTVSEETTAALQPGRWMVNKIPWLMQLPAWFPGQGFQRWAQAARERYFMMIRTPFSIVKDTMVRGDTAPCFVQTALDKLHGNSSEEEEGIVMSAAGSLYSAGTETITSAILTFILLMSRHPEIQQRAFEEISSVIDSGRLPGVQDKDLLPYVDCIIQEVHRFNPSIPLVTHSNTVTEIYTGYRIPKKSWIMANVWAMLHDDEIYDKPFDFNPDRFLIQDGKEVPLDPRTLVFGFGRRACPGLHLANTLFYLIVVRTLALFEILPEEQQGARIPPPLDFATGLVPTPKPFRCSIKPRPKTADILMT